MLTYTFLSDHSIQRIHDAYDSAGLTHVSVSSFLQNLALTLAAAEFAAYVWAALSSDTFATTVAKAHSREYFGGSGGVDTYIGPAIRKFIKKHEKELSKP